MSSSIQIYLSKESLNTNVYTSLSTAINLLIPNEAGDDAIELPIPEQLLTKIEKGRLNTSPVTHIGV